MLRGPLHNRGGADGLCEACGEPFPCPEGKAIYDAVIPRRQDANPRCSSCKSGPMFHPAHRWGPCQVRLPGGDLCGCSSPAEPPDTSHA